MGKKAATKGRSSMPAGIRYDLRSCRVHRLLRIQDGSLGSPFIVRSKGAEGLTASRTLLVAEPLRPVGDDNIPRPDVTKYPTPALSPKPVVSGHVGANDGIQNVLHRLELRSTADGDHGFAQPPQRGIGRERWPQARQVAPEVARKLSQSFPSLGKPSLLVLEDAG